MSTIALIVLPPASGSSRLWQQLPARAEENGCRGGAHFQTQIAVQYLRLPITWPAFLPGSRTAHNSDDTSMPSCAAMF